MIKGDNMKHSIHLVYWFNDCGFIQFVTSDKRTGSNPATKNNYKQAVESIKKSLGLTNKDTFEDIT